MTKLSPRGVFAVALLLSLVGATLIYFYLKNTATPAQRPGRPVVVAKVDIPARIKITPEMVREEIVPNEYVLPGAATGLAGIVGVPAREQIMAGEQITERRLVMEPKDAGFTGVIPPDKRAVSVAVTEVTGVTGLVKFGDYVDVVMTFAKGDVGENVSRTVLQNIQVLAVNRETEGSGQDKKEAAKITTVTLAVAPNDAAVLALADEAGKIHLALRPYQPSGGMVATVSVTPPNVVGSYAPAVSSDSGGQKPSVPPPSNNRGIQVIRGTKVETAAIN